jgi:Predicted membrane protein (DUF2232)
MQTNLLIGVSAGLVSAMLFASASTGTLLGLLVLFFLSPLPVAIAGLGWGWPSAVASAVTAAIAIAVAVTPRGAAFHVLAIGGPTAILSYLLLLNRHDTTASGMPVTEWYPIGRVMAVAAFTAGCLAAVGLLTTASDIDTLRDMLRATAERMFTRPPGVTVPAGDPPQMTPDQLTRIATLLVGMFTAALSNMWFGIAMLNVWLAGLVIGKSDRLVRPWPNLAALRLPRQLPLALVAAIGASFLPGMAGLIASGFASAFVLAYMFVGLAIVHTLSRGFAFRPMILAAVYAALFVVYVIAAPALAILGLAEPVSPLRRPPDPAT